MPEKPAGWRREPARHALAAKGVKTAHSHHGTTRASLRSHAAKWIKGGSLRTNRLDKAFELGFQEGDYEGIAQDPWIIGLADASDYGEHEDIFKRMHPLLRGASREEERELWEFLAYGWQFGSQHYGPSVAEYHHDQSGASTHIEWPIRTTKREREILDKELKKFGYTLDSVVNDLSARYHDLERHL